MKGGKYWWWEWPWKSLGLGQTGWVSKGSARISRPPAASQACRVQDTSLDEPYTPWGFVGWLETGSSPGHWGCCWEQFTTQILINPAPNGQFKAASSLQESRAAHLVDARCNVHVNGCRQLGSCGCWWSCWLEKRETAQGVGALELGCFV